MVPFYPISGRVWCHSNRVAGDIWVALLNGGQNLGSPTRQHHGRAVQFDPMKPMLKAPGTTSKRVETEIRWTAFKCCFHIQLAPLHHGSSSSRKLKAGGSSSWINEDGSLRRSGGGCRRYYGHLAAPYPCLWSPNQTHPPGNPATSLHISGGGANANPGDFEFQLKSKND